MTIRAAILARVSTAEQAANGRHSLANQVKMTEAYAEREGFEVVARFEIPGESAFTSDLTRRPKFEAAIRAAENHEFDVLICYDLSRFARDQRVLHNCLFRLREAGVRLIGVHNGIDYASDDGRDWAGIEGVFAEKSSREQGRRIRQAKDRRFSLGLPVGDVPFGYMRTGASSPPSVVPDEAEAIRWAFEAYALGMGYQAIASEWNRRGLQPHSKRRLTQFTVSSVQSVLENPYYAGVLRHKGAQRQGAHDAIVTTAAFERAQARTRRQYHAARKHECSLMGIAECFHCGGPLWTKPLGEKRLTGERRIYYWEPGRVRARSCVASGRSWRVEEADQQVEAAVLSLALDDSWLDEAERVARSRTQDGNLKTERDRLLAERQRAGVAMVEGLVTHEWAKRKIRDIDLSLKALPPEVAGPQIGRLKSIGEAWRLATPKQRGKLVSILSEGVALDVVEQRAYLKPTAEFRELLEFRQDYVETKCGGTPDRTRTFKRTSVDLILVDSLVL